MLLASCCNYSTYKFANTNGRLKMKRSSRTPTVSSCNGHCKWTWCNLLYFPLSVSGKANFYVFVTKCKWCSSVSVCCPTSTVTVAASTTLERINIRNVSMNCVDQGCANPGDHVVRATKLCTVALNICGSSVWYVLHPTFLASWILTRLLDFRKIWVPLLSTYPWVIF